MTTRDLATPLRTTTLGGVPENASPRVDRRRLFEELASCPRAELGVPLDRRCAPAPARLASPLFEAPALAALRRVFADGNDSVDAIRADLEDRRREARTSVNSCGWATREVAERVLDVLDDAALAFERGSPSALELTLDCVNRLVDRRGDADRARYGARAELVANARLATAPDFAEGVSCVLGDRRGEPPTWTPATAAARARTALDALDAADSFQSIRQTALEELRL